MAFTFQYTQAFGPQSGELAAQTLFTPGADMSYFLGIYVENSSVPPISSVQAIVQWTDVFGHPHYLTVTANNGVSGHELTMIHVKSGTDVVLTGTDFQLANPSQINQDYTITILAVGI